MAEIRLRVSGIAVIVIYLSQLFQSIRSVEGNASVEQIADPAVNWGWCYGYHRDSAA